MIREGESLFSKFPELAKEWHPIKNGELTPKDVAPFSNKKVWWLLPYNDPRTGRHFDFEWQAIINNRVAGGGCPYLSGKAVMAGFNDLATIDLDLAKQWHPTKNGKLTPKDVTAHSHKRVWWLLPYDDPKTGKHFDFEWTSSISSRAIWRLCPYLTGNAVWPGFNDLGAVNPDLAKQWHPTKNGDLTPKDVAANSQKKVWWVLPYDDPKTGKHFDFEWCAKVYRRTVGGGCPYLSGKAVWPGYNDLATVNPELAKEWHPTKNGDLTPKDVTANSNKNVWWLLPYEDPKTGKHFDFEWEEAISNRNRKNYGCPYLSNSRVWPGFNDLATRDPEIAKQWHPTKNGKLIPRDVVRESPLKVWWLLPYDDPDTGKHFDFVWKAGIRDRVDGKGCPYLNGHAVWVGFNDLATDNPDLAKEWYQPSNRKLTPQKVTAFSKKKVWWCCENGHIWRSDIYSRSVGCGCPMCYKEKNNT